MYKSIDRVQFLDELEDKSSALSRVSFIGLMCYSVDMPRWVRR
jgi:hypothetical protein